MVRVLLFLCLASVAAAQDVAEFGDGLAKVRRLMQHRRWAKSKAALDKLLETHADQGYVRARRLEVATLMKTCVFRMQTPEPKLAHLISGKLLKHDKRTGRVKIRYRRGETKDWITQGKFLLYPAPFDGPHSLTIKGRSYPSDTTCRVIVCHADGSYIAVDFGLKSKYVPRIVHVTPKKEKVTSQAASSPCVGGRAYTISIVVNSTTVTSKYNGRPLQRSLKRRKQWGMLGFMGLKFDELVISGKAEKSWLQGKLDEELTKRRAAFDKGYVEADHVPRWLFATPEANATLARPDGRAMPATLDNAGSAIVAKATKLHKEGKYEEGLRLVVGARLPDGVRQFLSTLFLESMSRYDEALVLCRKVRVTDPRFVPAAKREALLLGALRRVDEAVAVCETLLADYPGGADLHADVAVLYMSMGRIAEADRLVKAALARGAASPLLDHVAVLLSKAIHGPSWPRRFERKTRHYHVVTDIDQPTANHAGKILEQAYAAYVVRLERVKDLEKHRFKVYLFAGQGGYSAYCKEVFGREAAHSAGLYTPLLKQLLIWNLHRREEMMRTVRHEGFHQYLDRIMRDPPLWFNEGLAEYYEVAEVARGAWQLGKKHAYHLPTLRKKLVPLREFLYMDHVTFMANATQNYAQAWAFIQFLRHSTRENKMLFRRFWQAFKEIPSRKAAIDHALQGQSLAELHNEFAKHVEKY